MEKKKLSKNIIFIIISISFLFAFTGGQKQFRKEAENLNFEYSVVETEDEIKEYLNSKTINQIYNEINVLSQSGAEMSDFMYHAATLISKQNETTNDTIIEEISDVSNTENLRIILIDILRC